MKAGSKAGGSRKDDGKNKGKSSTGAGCFNGGHLKCAQSDDSGDLEPVLRRWLNGTTTSSGLNDCITITMANSATTAMRCMRLGMRIHGMTNRCLRRDTVFVWSSMPHRRRRRHHLLLLLAGRPWRVTSCCRYRHRRRRYYRKVSACRTPELQPLRAMGPEGAVQGLIFRGCAERDLCQFAGKYRPWFRFGSDGGARALY